MKRLKPKLTYANVIATLALIAAVAGGTTAIARIAKAPKNSVVAKSIKKGNVTARKLTTTVRIQATADITDPSPGDAVYASGSVVARCPQGARAITGGGTVGGNRTVLQTSAPSGDGTGWRASAGTDNPAAQILALVVCLLPRPGSPTETS
jgi:hypothetical protein